MRTCLCCCQFISSEAINTPSYGLFTRFFGAAPCCSYCGITTLPNGLVPLIQKFNPHIVELELSSNSLSDLPADIGKLQHLRVLRLKYNVFRKLPAVIKQLPQLMTLELSGNQIVKLDDGLLMACGQLKELDVSGNLLTELSPNIIHVQKLEVRGSLYNNANLLGRPCPEGGRGVQGLTERWRTALSASMALQRRGACSRYVCPAFSLMRLR